MSCIVLFDDIFSKLGDQQNQLLYYSLPISILRPEEEQKAECIAAIK